MDETLFYVMQYGMYVLYAIILFFILKTIFTKKRKDHHSNWNTLVDKFSFSSQEFYKLLREELNDHGITGMKISNARLKEGNMFSSRRLYLRVEWKEYQYDMCAAPFADGFFLSWWLLFKTSVGQMITARIPFIGFWLVKKWYPVTYYKVDTASMFMSYCHQSVLNVLDEITKDSGVRVNDTERKPTLKDFFKR